MVELQAFQPLIGGVLKTGGCLRSDAQYDDYFQELMVFIWQKRQTEQNLAAKNNNQLFKLLLWRLRDLQRKDWHRQDRIMLDNEIDLGTTQECYLGLWQSVKEQLPQHLHDIFQNVLDYPDLTLQERSHRLKIHRKSLRRRLDEIGEFIK